jgi:hypothetical protein
LDIPRVPLRRFLAAAWLKIWAQEYRIRESSQSADHPLTHTIFLATGNLPARLGFV